MICFSVVVVLGFFLLFCFVFLTLPQILFFGGKIVDSLVDEVITSVD